MSKTFEEIFTPYTVEELNGFRSEKIKRFFNDIKPRLIDNADGTFDLAGDFNCFHLELESLEELGFKIRKVEGNCVVNLRYLKDLKGIPEEVGEKFILGNPHSPADISFTDNEIKAVCRCDDVGWYPVGKVYYQNWNLR